jgi:hypothetical protein
MKPGTIVRTPKGAGAVKDVLGKGLVVVEVRGLLDVYRTRDLALLAKRGRPKISPHSA